LARLGVIIASTRPGRAGLPVGEWVVEQARAHGGFDEVETIDLLELDLPFFNEAKHPRFGEYEHDHTKGWSATVDALDAFVFVMPEYNHGVTAPLKNAFDYLHREWRHKPVALVSYGGVAAGTRAGEQMLQIVAALNMPVATTMPIPFVKQFVKDGRLEPNDVMVKAAPALFDELVRFEAASRALRD
jgi:NAD(P)H-dependent FMN reductase